MMTVVTSVSVLMFICVVRVTSEVTDVEKETAGDYYYSGYTVLRIFPENADQLTELHSLQMTSTDLDFWTEVRGLNSTVDVMVSPDVSSNFVEFLKKRRIPFSVLLPDVQLIVMEDTMSRLKDDEANQFGVQSLSWTKYHRLQIIHRYMDQLAVNNKDIVQVISIGKSYEGRDLKLIKIGKSSNRKKPAIWIDAGIHAREWIAPATATYIIDQLVNNYTLHKNLVDSINWYILPVINVDGYEYTHTDQRLWRKTRSRNGNSNCRGTDGNRNFGFNWNRGGSSGDPCSEIYRGRKAFSEVETSAIAKFVSANSENIELFLSLHSYGQLLLLPWGHTTDLPNDYTDLESLGMKAINALSSVYGTRYQVGNSNLVLYPTSGTSVDWAKGGAGIKYSFTLELPDTGRHGFVLPPTRILQTAIETWEAIKVVGTFVQNI